MNKINKEFSEQIYQIFNNEFITEGKNKQLSIPTFDKKTTPNIELILNDNITTDYIVKDIFNVNQFFIVWGYIEDKRSYILILDSNFKKVLFFDKQDGEDIPKWISLSTDANNYLCGLYLITKDITRAEQDISLHLNRYNDVLNEPELNRFYVLNTRVILANADTDDGVQITHNISNAWIGIDADVKIINIVISALISKTTEGKRGYFLSTTQLYWKQINFEIEDDITYRIISDFDNDIGNITGLTITSGLKNDKVYGLIGLVTNAGINFDGFFPVKFNGSYDVVKADFVNNIAGVPDADVIDYAAYAANGIVNDKIDNAPSIYHKRSFFPIDNGRNHYLIEEQGYDFVNTLYHDSKRFPGRIPPIDNGLKHVDGYDDWTYDVSYFKRYNVPSVEQYKLLRLGETIEDLVDGTDKGKINDVAQLSNYNIAFSSDNKIFIFEDNNNTMNHSLVSNTNSTISLSVIKSTYCDNVVTYFSTIAGNVIVGLVYKNTNGWAVSQNEMVATDTADIIVSMRQQNGIKINILDNKLNNNTLYQNTYDASDEKSNPYFFEPYNNFNNNFYIARILASKNNGLTYDGNTTNFVASKNLLVVSTIIAHDSSWADNNDYWILQSNTNNKMFEIAKTITIVPDIETLLTFNLAIKITDNTNDSATVFKAQASNTLVLMLEDNNEVSRINNNVFKTIRLVTSSQQVIDFDATDYVRRTAEGIFVEISLINYGNTNINYIILLNGSAEEIFKKQISLPKNSSLDAQFKIYFKEE